MKLNFVTATELKNTSGAVLDKAQKRPVGITKHGRLSHVVLDVEAYEALDPEGAKAAKEAARQAKIDALIEESHEQFGEVYKALAK